MRPFKTIQFRPPPTSNTNLTSCSLGMAGPPTVFVSPPPTLPCLSVFPGAHAVNLCSYAPSFPGLCQVLIKRYGDMTTWLLFLNQVCVTFSYLLRHASPSHYPCADPAFPESMLVCRSCGLCHCHGHTSWFGVHTVSPPCTDTRFTLTGLSQWVLALNSKPLLG